MTITSVRATPLVVPFTRPTHSSYGVRDAARVVMVEVEDDSGRVGIGESIAGPGFAGIVEAIEQLTPQLVGRDPRGVNALVAEAIGRITSHPGGDLNRFARRVVAGIDMALWDVNGKTAGVPASVLAGGPFHEDIGYFAFVNGDTADELAADAAEWAGRGHEIFYLKLGRGMETDLAAVAAVRDVIGDARLRLDPNEAWDVAHTISMARQLAPFEPEFLEQPVSSHSFAALASVRDAIPFAIAADQSIHSPDDVLACLTARAADLIVLGPHETGGLAELFKAAAITEAGGMRLCIHATVETQITACANHQAALAIPAIDDGNQDMSHLLAESLIVSPSMDYVDGRLGAWNAPGLGFEIDADAVKRAAARARAEMGR